jgi:hypothetical protein
MFEAQPEMKAKSPPSLHATLRVGVNVSFICLWALLASVFYLLSSPPPPLLVAVSVVCGLLAGVLQGKAMRAQPEALKTARDMMAVRKVLSSSSYGRASIGLQWLATLILVGLWLSQNERPFAGLLASYFSFMAAREAIGMKAVFWLNDGAKVTESGA